MNIRERLVPVLIERFADKGLRFATSPDAAASIPARHPEVGGVTLLIDYSGIRLSVGKILEENFDLFLAGVGADAIERTANSVVRFLDELLADRLLIWRSIDGRRGAWRERGSAGHSDPLVLDDLPYRTYVWSGPLATWQASPTVFARGYIRDEREYQIMWVRLHTNGPDGFPDPYRKLASELVETYERDHAV
jgi:hypothetical protein